MLNLPSEISDSGCVLCIYFSLGSFPSSFLVRAAIIGAGFPYSSSDPPIKFQDSASEWAMATPSYPLSVSLDVVPLTFGKRNTRKEGHMLTQTPLYSRDEISDSEVQIPCLWPSLHKKHNATINAVFLYAVGTSRNWQYVTSTLRT
jgi:hypothetical protein